MPIPTGCREGGPHPSRQDAAAPRSAPRVARGTRLAALALCTALAAAGCSRKSPLEGLPDPGLAFAGPYPAGPDKCLIVGDTTFTADLRSAGTDLVACPAGFTPGVEMATALGAEQVASTRNYTLFNVPRPAAAQ